MTENLSLKRSILFVPGSKPERFSKAANSGADIYCIDLEDAVAPAQKLGLVDNDDDAHRTPTPQTYQRICLIDEL